MRTVIDLQSPLGSVPIEQIALDEKSRDDIPALLKGLQLIYTDPDTRKELFELLEAHIRPDTDRTVGRPGMEMWRILVLGILKEGLNCDFDRLHDLANEHRTIRKMLGHGMDGIDNTYYVRARIVDNVALLTPELLREVNRLVVSTGHTVAKKKPGEMLAGRCDSFVVETDVHYPTDFNLLLDSTRCLIRETGKACELHDVKGWRQHRHLTKQVRKRFNRVATARLWTKRPDQVSEYLKICRKMAGKAEESLVALKEAGASTAWMEKIRHYLKHVHLFTDQIDRRVLQGEVIEHSEKIFSVFEEHTRWISKGKAGRPVELGVPLAIVEDQHQFVLDYQIMWQGGDVDVAVPLIESCQEMHPDLQECSFDRGFHSPENRRRLENLLDMVALPKKGRLNAADQERESEENFSRARKQHPAVESAINHLEHHGLDRVRAKGADGFERTVGLAIVAANLHQLGRMLQKSEKTHRDRHRLAA